MPKNSRKRFPKLSALEAANLKGPDCSTDQLMSIANINAYLNRLGSFFNWAESDDLIERNPMRGLRLNDDIHKRDKRKHFSADQLNTIFNAPLYTGCVNDAAGYYKIGTALPRGSRYWVPLLGLFTGMRLNEICQLEFNDIDLIDGIPVIKISLETANSNLTRS